MHKICFFFFLSFFPFSSQTYLRLSCCSHSRNFLIFSFCLWGTDIGSHVSLLYMMIRWCHNFVSTFVSLVVVSFLCNLNLHSLSRHIVFNPCIFCFVYLFRRQQQSGKKGRGHTHTNMTGTRRWLLGRPVMLCWLLLVAVAHFISAMEQLSAGMWRTTQLNPWNRCRTVLRG